MKICISGPAASGKTYSIDQFKSLPFVVGYPEGARKVAELEPGLAQKDLSKFRKTVCNYQVDIESLRLESNDTVHIYDRGLIDNLAFLFLQDDPFFPVHLSNIASLYRNKILSSYDTIFYYDIALFIKTPDMLIKALSDPLRKATIDLDNYLGHVAEFKKAFIEITEYLGLKDKLVITTAYPDEEGFDKRNGFVRNLILSAFGAVKEIDHEYA